MKRELAERGVAADKIAVIPHGTRHQTLPPRAESRRALGVPEGAKVVLFFGFIWHGKGIDFLLSAFARVARRVPEALLYVGGYTRVRKLDRELYMLYLKTRMRLLGIRDRVLLYGDYVPEELMPRVYAAADVVALPYLQAYSSVSAVVHAAAGMGRIPFCSHIAKFEEVAEGISPDLVAAPRDAAAWADGLTRLLTDPAHHADLSRRVARFADATSWSRVGAARLALFDQLRGQARARAAG
jgi:glycosyltransferase involved in cell wall biosynthesis